MTVITRVTITKQEREEALDHIMKDPCGTIDCSGLVCDSCPLREVSHKLRKAQEDFARALNQLEEEEEQEK